MHLNRLTQPAAELLPLSQAKSHLKVDFDDDDAYISMLITIAREYCEDYTHRGLGVCDYELILDRFPLNRDHIELPVSPLRSVAYVEYVDASGTTNTFDPSNYLADIDRYPGAVYLPFAKIWPCNILQPGAAVRIKFSAGHTSADVPQRIFWAMLLLIGYWYDNREAVAETKYMLEIPTGVDALLAQVRVW